ncbi:MAG: GAF domain-containing protein, partial [Myxococcota bacterium]
MRIDAERQVIGSAGDILASGLGVEPEHAELIFRDGLVGVRDLGTPSGTWVDGQRMPRRVLRVGRTFRIGGTKFELLEVHLPNEATGTNEVFDDLQTRLLDVRGGNNPVRVATPLERPAPPIVDAAVIRDVPSPAPVPARAPRPAVKVSAPTVGTPARVVIAEADPNTQAWLRQAIGGQCWLATTQSEVLAHLAQQPRLVVVVGYRLVDVTPNDLVATLGRPQFADRVAMLAVDGVAPTSPDLYYRISPGMPARDLQRIVASAARPKTAHPDHAPSDTRAWHDKQVFEICAAASARPDPVSAAHALEEGVGRLLNVGRVACIFHDASAGALWTETGDPPVDGNANSGIVGFVARTAEPVHAPQTGSDPRYDARIDNPNGNGTEALLAVPIVAHGEVHAVLAVTRQGSYGMFDRKSCERLMHLARELGPIFARLEAAVSSEEALQRRQRPQALQLYRPEAVEAYLNRGEEGEVIRIAPHWTTAMYWTLLAMVVVGVIGMAIGSIGAYSTGPAVIRQGGRAEVAALG